MTVVLERPYSDVMTNKSTLSIFIGLALSAILPLLASCSAATEVPSTITFKSKDGLAVTADLYAPYPNTAPFIVLCHRAGWSRGEYKEIAPWLNSIGVNCLAIDQRSGGKINMVSNETMAAALKRSLDTGYLDAEQDMVAALEFARKKHAKGKLLLWGSSYSSSLALVIAASEPGLADGVLSFSPGEYFTDAGKPNDYVLSNAARVTVPVFIATRSSEAFAARRLFEALTVSEKKLFIPENGGRHGSESLWSVNALSGEYREETRRFLADYFL